MRHAGGSAADDWPQNHVSPGGNGSLRVPERLAIGATTAPPQAQPGAQATTTAPPVQPQPTSPGPIPPVTPAPAPVPVARRRPRLYIIDATRLFAAIFVALHHYAGTLRVNEAHNPIWGRPVSHIMPSIFRVSAYGWIGVEIFFVISGFVICMSCWDRRPRDFFVSRVIRLYPAYWFGVLFTTGVLTLWPKVWKPLPARDVIYNLSMLQEGTHHADVDGVYWTLYSELRFYLLFLIVVATGLTYRKVVIFCCVWAVVAAFAPAANLPVVTLIANSNGVWYFIAGLTLYLMHRFGPDLLLWGMLGFTWVMSQDEISSRITHVEHVSSWRGALTIYTVFLLFMVAVALGKTDRLQWKWLATAGSLTYPFYLLHYAAGTTAIYYLRDRMDARVLVAGLIAVFLLASYGVHRLVERPLSKIIKRGLNNAFDNLGKHSAS
jgi:peptidoglycan/LPS O-acetylase OafA/YrhL